MKKILIANRGEIACRIIRTCKKMGHATVAIFSEADRFAPHVTLADEAYFIGDSPVRDSYLQKEKIIALGQECQVDALHPGYGLLSENAEFAEACERAGIRFLGPTSAHMKKFGLKHTARELAEAAGVPLVPGTGILKDLSSAREAARGIGYPVMLKSTAGGGGIGMKVCADEKSLIESYEQVERLAQNHFGQKGIFLEKYIACGRHIEVQIFGDGQGKVITLGERDCSTQRRNQKVIEETPAPNLSDAQRLALQEAARRLAEAVQYESAGTVEFIYDVEAEKFYFLEVNTRLQVEHGVTEEIFGIDLVEWMILQGTGEGAQIDFSREYVPHGHAMQARVYAEDPIKNFEPSAGLLTEVVWGAECRCDTWIQAGTEVSPYYDPLLGKIIVHEKDRESALHALLCALEESRIYGIETNLEYLRNIVASSALQAGTMHTKYLQDFNYASRTIDVLRAGTLTTVQDLEGRTGYWHVGIPPSGAMDGKSFALANRLVGNPENAAGLEITLQGPRLQFLQDTMVALTGAQIEATLDGQSIAHATAVPVAAGQVLDLGAEAPAGLRSYLAIAGGLEVPDYLGSKATFTLGKFGGHCGRKLQVGDVLHINEDLSEMTEAVPPADLDFPLISDTWEISVAYGPHGAPDFFLTEYLQTFLDTSWEVHYNSARTGIRLMGPTPGWARPDGGEAGLHPSNLHDNPYAVGAIDFTGDMPIILGPDGPSLGGFVCPFTIKNEDLWKMGQLKPGDHVRFICTEIKEGILALDGGCVLARLSAEEAGVPVVCRRSGDANILIEYGEMVLDMNLRFHVHTMMNWMLDRPWEGILDVTPGIRSLQVHFDPAIISLADLLEKILKGERAIGRTSSAEVPSRIVHLPLSWDDPSTQLAIDRYAKTVREDAPWCPSNIEFIRRINGLDTIEDVKKIVFGAHYLVMGLGDVYLGAPVATPLDPRHRLVTTKYNPARTWTPENAVGIGGAYLCIYGMEGPGGYQFVGRTLQMWNRYEQTAEFKEGQPWLLDFFDQIKFYPVTTEELDEIRRDFLHGRYPLKIEKTTFSLEAYNQFLEEEKETIAQFRAQQATAFQAERARWAEAGIQVAEAIEEATVLEEREVPAGLLGIEATSAGSVWKICVQSGDVVKEGDLLVVLEAMKMEIPVLAEAPGTIEKICVSEGTPIKQGDILFHFKPS